MLCIVHDTQHQQAWRSRPGSLKARLAYVVAESLHCMDMTCTNLILDSWGEARHQAMTLSILRCTAKGTRLGQVQLGSQLRQAVPGDYQAKI